MWTRIKAKIGNEKPIDDIPIVMEYIVEYSYSYCFGFIGYLSSPNVPANTQTETHIKYPNTH